MHIGQPVMASLELEGEPQMVDAQAMKDRRVQIVYVYGLLRDVVTELIGGAV
jgi:hypothetical protein